MHNNYNIRDFRHANGGQPEVGNSDAEKARETL
jgi:hypothetical protein